MRTQQKEDVLRLLHSNPIDYVARKIGVTRNEILDLMIENSGGIPPSKVKKRGYQKKNDKVVEERARLLPEEKLGYVRALENRLFAAIKNNQEMSVSERKGSDLEKDINEMMSEYCRFVV